MRKLQSRDGEAAATGFGTGRTRDRYIHTVANRMLLNACVGATSTTSRALYAAAAVSASAAQ
eukprot:3383659-Amphidinium_carterae.1